ncbi:MAG: PD-(D/E)XK nuclease family protein [Anaerolineae bacterium]|nr:PD-(D/E)XK nuclease family protein [Anaerolineae bacterium]
MTNQSRLPEGYLFSQHSLNTYSRCKRRFWLRYVARMPWPVPQDDDPLAYEAHLERGRILHQWIQRDLLGLPVAAQASSDDKLGLWWQRYQAFDWGLVPSDVREPELPVTVVLGGHRLYARYDLVALDRGGQVMVVDWKTLETPPSRNVLERRVQTRVYLYTLARVASSLLGGEDVSPERISMLYWFTNRPNEPTVISYGQQAYQTDALRLEAMMTEISQQPREAFRRTDQPRQCATCNYRTLCQRGDIALDPTAAYDWLDDDLAQALELEAVPEVPY